MFEPDAETLLALLPNMNAAQAQTRLRSLASPEDARFLQRFFKTGPGDYGEGDQFLGIRVPVTRKLACEFRSLPTEDLVTLLQSPFHEERLLALVVMVNAYHGADESRREEIYRLYMEQLDRINNWDLVDVSAPGIVGRYLAERPRDVLFRLARSKNLWHRRVAMLTTLHFIRAGDFADALRLAEQLRDDEHDLMHKAVGWMLREIGKRDLAVLKRFLDHHAAKMPRTMLRYALEKLPERERRAYLRAGKTGI